MCYGVPYFLLTAYICLPLHSPTEYMNQPKALVIITNIYMKRTARRMKGNAEKYAEGGNIIRIDGLSTLIFFSGLSTACLSASTVDREKCQLPPPPPALNSFKFLELPRYATSGRRKRCQLLSPVVNVNLIVLVLSLWSSKHIRCSLLQPDATLASS